MDVKISIVRSAKDGTVYTWGVNSKGELGDNTTTNRTTPVQVLKGDYSGNKYLGDNTKNPVIAVSALFYNSIAMAADGTLYNCGLNRSGQLGDNTTTDRLIPVKVLGIG